MRIADFAAADNAPPDGNMTENDTIAALATPPGLGGVGVIRISGPACRDIAFEILGSIRKF